MTKKTTKKNNNKASEEKVNVNPKNKDVQSQEEISEDYKVEEKTDIGVEETENKAEPDNEDKKNENDEIFHQLKEVQEKYIRLSAEFDNYRKRTLKEKAELLKTAGEETIIKILPVMDDFERAIQSMDEAKEIEAVKHGIQLIYGKFRDFLKQQGVSEIKAIEEDFDTDIHEAVTKIPASDDKLKGKVVDVIEKGYKLNDKVIRYSKVVVGE